MSEESHTKTLSQRHRGLIRRGDIARGKRPTSGTESVAEIEVNPDDVADSLADGRAESASGNSPGRARTENLVDGRFRLLARLGGGRLGDIFEARIDAGPDASIDRHVALQLFDRNITADSELVDQLRRGFASLRAGPHRNIVRLDEFSHTGKTGFLVMELLEGASLQFVLDDVGRLPADEAMPIVRSVGDALSYLHAKRIVHGALTPSAVFVEEDYTVKLLDIVPAPQVLTMLAEGQPPPTPKDDIYGLACLAYELLSGRHPFNYATASEARQLGLVPQPIADLPSVQWLALAHGLALDPEHRSSSVASFLQDLSSSASGRAFERVPPVSVVAGSEADQPIIPTISDRIDFSSPPPARGRWARRAVKVALLGALIAAAWIYRDPIREAAVQQLVAVGFDLIGGREDRDAASVLATGADPERATETVPAIDAESQTELQDPVQPLAAADAGNESESFALGERPAAEAVDEAVDEPTAESVAASPNDDARAEAPPDPAPPDPAELNAAAPDQATPDQATPDQATPDPAVPDLAAVAESDPAPPESSPGPAPETRFIAPPVARVAEGGPPLAIPVRREGDAAAGASLVWWTGSDTAMPGDDYADLGEQREAFAPGELTVTIFVPIVDDGIPEPLEGFAVHIGRQDPVSGRTVLVGTTRIVIEDNDNSRF